ncbi:benzoate-CoA ligase family protein [Bradyrhizobium sp. Tv2a-2]|uniref:benzoate-CoA ligase family protein n=1 Tax=Bradyrhizobium sp. Tv2a-2 TaxID=113395 RepID=UPI00040F15FC|nr:benzoate-CoA ligase family protein [Bradyrhizobium sp. Tv2a-2]
MTVVPDRYNVSTMLDRNLALGRSDKTAIICDDQRISFGELFARVCRMGNALLRLDVRAGERVMLVLSDTPFLAVAFWGALRIGAVPCLLNPAFQEDAYRHFVLEAGASLVVTDEPWVERVARSLGDIRSMVILAPGASRDRTTSVDELLAAAGDTLAPAGTHREDMAFWLYSSASTGRPKAIVHAHQGIPATCETYARQTLGITEHDICFARALYHAYGLGGGLTFPAWAGATSVLSPRRPTPAALLEIIDNYKPTLLFLVPALYKAILDDHGSTFADLASVRRWLSAAEPLSPEIWSRWRDKFDAEIMDGIGSTELLHIFCSNAPGALKVGSSGKPVPGYELRLVGDDGLPIRTGNVGRLQVRGPSSSMEYWRQRTKTQEVIVGHWVATGDIYRLDDDGYYWFEGREDDMVKIAGEWVSPGQIEGVLITHPAVAEVAVTPQNVDGLSRIRASVVLARGLVGSNSLARELQKWCQDHLERYKYAHIICFVEHLPRNASGKGGRPKLNA